MGGMIKKAFLQQKWKQALGKMRKSLTRTEHWITKHHQRIAIGAVSLFIFAVGIIALATWFVDTRQVMIRDAETVLRFGAIGDFEYGTRINVGNKLTSRTRGELEKVISFYNNDYHPAFVIELGDMIESSGLSPEKAKKQFRDIDAVFQTVNARREYVLGNHDLRSLSKAEGREILSLDDNHRYFDEGDWRFVIMDSNFDEDTDDTDRELHHTASGYISSNEYTWLETALATDRPTIVFSHHPIIPGKKNVHEYEKVRSFLERYPNIVLSISGHHPSFRFSEEDGIHYLVVDNLANRDSIGSFATLDAHYNPLTKEARVLIEHYGPTRRTVEAKKVISTNRPWWIDTLDQFNRLP